MKRNAFTLIELMIVLTIIGLIMGGSMKFAAKSEKRAKINYSKKMVETGKEAMLGYISSAEKLPSKEYFQNNLSPVTGADKKILYSFASDANDKNICSLRTTNLSVESKGYDSGTKQIKNILFVLTSPSANGNLQTKEKDDVVTLEKPFEKIDDEPNPINKKEEYDDQSVFVTLSEAQRYLSCYNKTVKIINTSLPSTSYNNSPSYKANIYIDGNFNEPTYDNCTFSDAKFSYSDFEISHSSEHSSPGVVKVKCEVKADGLDIFKVFTITINDDRNN